MSFVRIDEIHATHERPGGGRDERRDLILGFCTVVRQRWRMLRRELRTRLKVWRVKYLDHIGPSTPLTSLIAYGPSLKV